MTTETAPARILLQIREGVTNELFAGQIELHNSRAVDDGRPGVLDHDVSVDDIIALLAQALRNEVSARRSGLSARDLPIWNNWIEELAEWIVNE